MVKEAPVLLQTMYAELTERAHLHRLQSDFEPTGSFIRKERRGREYWYFRSPMEQGVRRDRYVGPDSLTVRQRIDRHASEKDSYRQRRSLVGALLHSGFKGPDARTGHILEALEAAGVFRLRAVIVGTVAYQTYSGLLGVKLAATNTLTKDLDVAQFRTISIAVKDQLEPSLLSVLKTVEPAAEPMLETFEAGKTWRYAIGGDQYWVEVLTPNRGPNDDSLGDAQKLALHQSGLRRSNWPT